MRPMCPSRQQRRSPGPLRLGLGLPLPALSAGGAQRRMYFAIVWSCMLEVPS